MDYSLNRTGAIAISLLFILTSSLAGHSALAAEATAPVKRYATVLRIQGDVAASDGNANRKLHEGDPVYVGEHVRAKALAEAVLKTEDAGIVAIRPNTEFIAERYVAEDKPTDNFTLRLVTGSLRVISGWIGHTNRAGSNVVTSSATIGIRGTDHEPYVLSSELASSTGERPGTYDKVNRGGTTMQVGENKLDIDKGRVGFARAATPGKQRALLTILLPVLLDKVPNFYIPGQFDAELDLYSETADQEGLRQLEQKRQTPDLKTPDLKTPDLKTADAAPEQSAPQSQHQLAAPDTHTASNVTPDATPAAVCEPTTLNKTPTEIANTWLSQMDAAITRHDAPSIIAMFAPEATVRATVRGKDGEMVSVDIGREELAQSTLAAIKGLKNFSQRRMWTGAKLEHPSGTGCNQISLRSVVVEQGRQSGKPYRFESLEKFMLELRDGKWLAIKAETTQQ